MSPTYCEQDNLVSQTNERRRSRWGTPRTAPIGKESSTCRWKVWFPEEIVKSSRSMPTIKYSVESGLLTGEMPSSVAILDMTSLVCWSGYKKNGFVQCPPLSLFLLALWTHTIPCAQPARASPCLSVNQTPLLALYWFLPTLSDTWAVFSHLELLLSVGQVISSMSSLLISYSWS